MSILYIFCLIIAILILLIFKSSRNRYRFVQVALAALLISSPLFYEFPKGDVDSPAVVISLPDKDGTAEVCQLGAFTIGRSRFFNVPERSFVASSVTPITENPKARHISYKVAIEMAKPEIFFRLSTERLNKTGLSEVEREIKEAVEFWLYEFNNANSRELAKLYNPLAKSQVQDLEWMLLPWLNDKIGQQGLKAISVSFAVE